jgi:hypothetical protein
MRAVRAVLVALGLIITGYGAALLLDEPRAIMLRIVLWSLVGVVVHDLVFAPLCVALGFAGRRLISQKWWGPVAVAALCSVVLVMLAIPVFDKPGMRPDNLTVLDRDYHAGLWISLAIVWACVPLYLLAARLLPRRKR